MEILKSHFKDDEQVQFEAKLNNDPTFKEKFEKIKGQQIDLQLDKLQNKVDKTKDSFEKRYESFKKAVLEVEKNQNTWVIETVKEKADKILDEKKEKFNKELREKADKKIPFIGWALFDFAADMMKASDDKDAWFLDKIFSKVGVAIWGIILGFLGLKKGYEELIGMRLKKIKVEDIVIPSIDPSNINKPKEKFYYHSWMWSLLHLSGINLDSWDDTKDTLNKFQNESLTRLEDIKISWNFKWKELTLVDKKVLKTLLNKDTTVLLKSSLKDRVLEKTLENNKLKLEQLLWSEYYEILTSISNWNLKIKNLSLNAISILSLFSINSFWILAINWVSEKFEWLFDYFGTDTVNLEDIKKDIEWRKNWIISSDLITALNVNNKIHILKAKWTDKKVKNDLVNFDNQEELNKLIDFKNWLLSNEEFLWEKSKTLLWKFDKWKIFKTNLSYAGLIAIYTILWWKQSLDNLNTLDLPVLYKVISVILWRDNAAEWSDYLSNVMWYFASSNANEDIFKDENDKKALSIITKRLAFDYLNFIIRQTQEKLGYLWLFTNKYINDWMFTAAWLWLKKVWWKMLKKWAVFSGSKIKWLWYLTIISWIASAIHTTYNKWSNIFKELSEFEDKEFSKLAEDELKVYIKKAEELNKKMITRDIEVNWNLEKVLFFTWNNWLEIIHNGKIYKLWVWFKRFWDIENFSKDIVANLWEFSSWFLDFIKQEIPKDYSEKIAEMQKDTTNWSMNKTFKFKWKEYDFSNVKILWNDIIIKWSPDLKYTLKKLVTKFINSKNYHPKKTIGDEEIVSITYKVIEEWNTDDNNIILLEQWQIEV